MRLMENLLRGVVATVDPVVPPVVGVVVDGAVSAMGMLEKENETAHIGRMIVVVELGVGA